MSEALGEFAADLSSEAVDAAAADAASGASTVALKDRLRISADGRRSVPRDDLLHVQFKEELSNIILGVALAGGFWPIVMWGVFALIGSIRWIWMGGLTGMLLGLLMSAIGCAISGVIAFIYATFVFVAVYWIVYWFVRSLQMRGNVVWLAAFSGGLTGFAAVLPAFVFLVGMDPQIVGANWGLVMGALTLAGPTTVMGQIGGAWGVLRDRSYERAVAAAAVVGGAVTVESSAGESVVDRPADVKWIQFRIWHLLVLSFWVSLLLTAIRLCGIDVTLGIVLLSGWAVFQAITLLAGGLLFGWWMRWKGRRKTRST